jgi:acyl-CoA synthetase (AMP-forming)/AMP-acid ligase II
MSYLPPEDIDRKPDSIGIAIPNGRLWIEDSKGHIVEQSDSVGELIYSGENVSMGYARSIIDLELGDKNARILKTGDLARFDSEGYFFIKGSNNRFVKLFGNRISLDSLEKILSNKGFESVATGDDKKIVIHIINHPNLSQDSLRSELSEVIGINHVAIKINVISEFPRLDNGKIDYKSLNNNQ